MERVIIDNDTMYRTLRRLSYEIIEKNKVIEDVCIVGIKSKGINLAKIISENIKHIEGLKLDTGSIDVTPFRDDIETELSKDINNDTMPFDIKDKVVVLVDDVLYTGRTIRAAMDALIYLGRPKRIELLVLVDRGHRELPIRADFVGKNIPTSSDEVVKVIIDDNKESSKVLIRR